MFPPLSNAEMLLFYYIHKVIIVIQRKFEDEHIRKIFFTVQEKYNRD